MIHKIKSLFDKGNGLSRRRIAAQLKISRRTVNKYLSMTEDEITAHLTDRSREKQLDPYKEYILHLLQTWPDLSAQKIYQKLTKRQQTLRHPLEVSGVMLKHSKKPIRLARNAIMSRYWI